MSTWATSDIMDYVALFNKGARNAIRERCGMSLTGYRALAYVADHGDVRPGELSRTLGAKPPAMSKVTNALCSRGLALRAGGRNGAIRITEKGRRRLPECDEVLVEVVNEFFSGTTDDLSKDVVAGSIATAMQHGVARMRNGAYFGEYACLYGFSLSEQIFKKSSQAEGLSLGEFRLLVKANESPQNSMTDLCRSLNMSKSEISRYASGLIAKKLLARRTIGGNRRTLKLETKSAAAGVIRAISIRIDEETTMLVRQYNDDEIAFSNRLARAILSKRETDNRKAY